MVFRSDFPESIQYYHAQLNFENDEDKNFILDNLSERVSKIYSDFLTKDWHRNRVNYTDLNFEGLPQFYPSSGEVAKFKKIIQTDIVENLHKEGGKVVYQTDTYPICFLSEHLNKCEIPERHYLYFPQDTTTLLSRETVNSFTVKMLIDRR